MTTFAQFTGAIRSPSVSTTDDFALTEDGTDIAMASHREAYANIITDTIRTVRGEIQLDTTVGVDYFDSIFDSTTKIAFWKDEIGKIINSYPFVIAINSFDANYDQSAHTLHYKIVIATDDGEITVEA